jgi:hypothetical protein
LTLLYCDQQVITMNARVGLLLVVLPGLVAAQATVEYATSASRAATTAAPAQKAGKAVAGALDNLTRTLQTPENSKPAARGAATAPSRSRKASLTSEAAKPQVGSGATEPNADLAFEDPSGIKESMEYDEILRRFGPPSLKMTTAPGEETLCYARKDLMVDVMVRNGKITNVRKSGEATQAVAKAP